MQSLPPGTLAKTQEGSPRARLVLAAGPGCSSPLSRVRALLEVFALPGPARRVWSLLQNRLELVSGHDFSRAGRRCRINPGFSPCTPSG